MYREESPVRALCDVDDRGEEHDSADNLDSSGTTPPLLALLADSP